MFGLEAGRASVRQINIYLSAGGACTACDRRPRGRDDQAAVGRQSVSGSEFRSGEGTSRGSCARFVTFMSA